jgi:signal transduction histidine kinase
VDAARLEQALGNLVDNAVTHGGGEVTLVGARRDGVIELHVIDQGEGFPPAFLSRAFERFSRPDAARNGRGSGLGLSIVETIARSHGGTARAQNRTPSGAEVVITLPIDGTPEGG